MSKLFWLSDAQWASVDSSYVKAQRSAPRGAAASLLQQASAVNYLIATKRRGSRE